MMSRFARICKGRALLAIVLLCTGVARPLVVQAQLDPDEQQCRATIAKAYGKYIKAAQKVITGCHAGRNSLGNPLTDCNDVATADTESTASGLAGKAAIAVVKACDLAPEVILQFDRCPTPFESFDDGPLTTGIDTASELASCIEAHSKYMVESLAERILGSPLPVPLGQELRACHAAIGKAYTKYVNTIVKVRSKCQTTLDQGGSSLLDFDQCVLSDTTGKIEKIREKSAAKIQSACSPVAELNQLSVGRAVAYPRSIGSLGSCADDVAGIIDCALDKSATVAASGLTAMLWELPGVCPESGSYIVSPRAGGTELDVGWTGVAHDRDPLVGYRAVRFTIDCDADCANCASTAVNPAPGACRCSGDASIGCATSGVDPACTGLGSCECFYGPPTPYSAGNNPACVLARIAGTMTGSLNPTTGEISLAVPLRQRIHLGQAITAPCPLCVAGACAGGERDALPCTVDATDSTYGAVSYDCPPSAGSNISGIGVQSTIEYTTGSVSLPFGTQCATSGPFAGYACACAACSGDNSVACQSNADCAALAAGTCDASSQQRRPNQCSSGTCTDVGDGEGECTGDFDRYCDGWVTSRGGGIVSCSNNSDCVALAPACPGGNCGTCSLDVPSECFLDPIEATGAPGSKIVGTGCVGQTSNPGVNAVLGLPGAFRLQQNLDASELLCPDGETVFFPPGGSNCPTP